ncbi:MAG: methylmalonyl Co-A mutase-associated GTPase MeaB [Nitrospira sp.]|nr:methylmalonyl Co-A mutase-associated GTPase MeaB [Nitrospira sp.]
MKILHAILKGDIRAAARLMTMIEEGRAGTKTILNSLRPHTGKAHRIGITGFPGAGKSTLIDQLIQKFREQGKKVGVVAVDVSSPITSGAILGDRIRMKGHAMDKGVFIRSMATRGHLGGLARKTLEIITVLEAIGKEIILIETVGVGQAEVEVAKAVHTTLVVVAPGLGDDIQAMKAGLLEIAHLFVVNKSDLPGADDTLNFLHESLNLTPRKKIWQPLIYKTVALKGQGIEEIIKGMTLHRTTLSKFSQEATYGKK